MKFYKSKKLLNIDNNAKTVKGQKYKYLTGILYLAPARISGFNVCSMASEGCKASCLFKAGRGKFNNVIQGRINKTRWFFLERDTFLKQLKKEIKLLIIKAKKMGLKPAVRLNGTSDIEFDTFQIFQSFPNVQFYDYTKVYKRAMKYIKGEYPKNYYITYSLNEDNRDLAFDYLTRGGNVAIVFRNKKLPKRYFGFKVINADKSDLRFKDPYNTIAGLYAKGRAIKDTTGFVQDV